jgi:ectoine hydroxylase-related dioxygenase (phytanoyl-CoA dioxygenase family)
MPHQHKYVDVMRQQMIETSQYKQELLDNGFTTMDDIYSTEEIEKILSTINEVDSTKDTFRKSTDLFAIRQFLKEVPRTNDLIFNKKLKSLIRQLGGQDYFIVKSIYFDKPETSNWYVSYHQDLTISVDKKLHLADYGPWTIKQNQFAVQPPIDILENIITIRVHLDDADEKNGALRVIPKSHLKKIYRPGTIDWATETESICKVNAGGLMIMKPLILHSSGRTINLKKRRVIHIELSNKELPTGLLWSERMSFD